LDLDAGFKGNMATKGWAEFQQLGKVSKETMQANFLLLHTLLDINKVGIFKRVQSKDGLLALDVKLMHKLSSARQDAWADMEASLINANFMALTRNHRNSGTKCAHLLG